MVSNISKVTILTVTHNAAAVIETMIESIPHGLAVVVIDNASVDNTLSMINKLHPDAHIIKNKIGLGYGNAMNIGLRNISTEFALLVNPDTILSKTAINQLINTAIRYPEAGLVGPMLLTPDGTIETSYDVEVHKRTKYGKRDRKITVAGPICVESISGAAILARMSCLEEINFFDPSYFLYFEDDDMCKLVRNSGYSIIFDPLSVISHHGGGSVPSTPSYHWEKFWHMSWSRLYYEKKHIGIFSTYQVFLKDMPKFAIKALYYGITCNLKKARRDAARCCGMLAFMTGKQASQAHRNNII